MLPTARAAQGVGLLLFFGLLFIAGGGPPPYLLPDVLNAAADFTAMGPPPRPPLTTVPYDGRMPIINRLTEVPAVAAGRGYAHAVTVSGKLAFVAGQVAFDADGRLVGPSDLAAQTRQSLRNVHAILRTLGADWPDVVRFNWYLVDATAVQTIRDVRDEFLRPALGDRSNPASTLVQVVGLFRPEFLVEVDAVVALPE